MSFNGKNRSERGFKIHKSLQIYIERRYGKDLHKNETKPTLEGNKYWL